jgi:DNA helicase-2/ATP-dependent DNA helicase PcrA
LKIEVCKTRQAIIDHEGHLLVLGGPGSGKTTIALLKAQKECAALKPGQEILFLSFSRAAVRQVLDRCRSVLTTKQRQLIQVMTYHHFCLDFLESHGRLLAGRPVCVLYPGPERLRKVRHQGDWSAEQQRLAGQECLFCFDMFGFGVARLLEGCKALRQLVADKYPLVIIDEFQDTDDDQWRMVHAMALETTVFFLADPEQRIFEYRDTVDPKRLDTLRKTIAPKEFDLGGENHRSPTTGILAFADAVLKNKPLPATSDVKLLPYRGKDFASTVHAAVMWTFSQLRKKGLKNPCVAVFGRSNLFVAQLSGILAERHTYKGRELSQIDHDVVWDAELSAAAATVVGSIMEWSGCADIEVVTKTLSLIAHYYELKNAANPSQAATDAVRKFDEAAVTMAAGGTLRINAAKALKAAFQQGFDLTGDPVNDWRRARHLLKEIKPLNDLFREARLVRLFRATDALGEGLSALWLASGRYAGASRLVRQILERERLIAAEHDPEGCILMTLHKSKGKEFDGVVMVEGAFSGSFFDTKWEKPPYERSRRLLRVSITRARTLVMIVRPHDAVALTS